jgi:hypothetical protein
MITWMGIQSDVVIEHQTEQQGAVQADGDGILQSPDNALANDGPAKVADAPSHVEAHDGPSFEAEAHPHVEGHDGPAFDAEAPPHVEAHDGQAFDAEAHPHVEAHDGQAFEAEARPHVDAPAEIVRRDADADDNHGRGPTLHRTPSELHLITPPCCSIYLSSILVLNWFGSFPFFGSIFMWCFPNKDWENITIQQTQMNSRLTCAEKDFATPGNDHRWKEKWLKGIRISSYSKSFDYKSEADWVQKLEMVHEHAWMTWKQIKDKEDMKEFPLQLPHEVVEQKGGKISQELVTNLRPQVARLPPKKK